MTGAPSGSLSWGALLAEAERDLGSRSDARRVVTRAGGFEWAELATAQDRPVPPRAELWAREMVQRRRAGEPLQYVLGVWGFRSLDLLVDRRALIPRPETEVVAGIAVECLRELACPSPVVVDLGTGTGAIALAVATEVPAAAVWATDTDADALAVARANLAGAGSAVGPRVRLVQGSWYGALAPELAGRVDLVVSNPPYVAESEDLPDEVAAWEPRAALVAGTSGLEAVAEITAGASRWLAPGGWLVVEIAPHQAGEARALAQAGGLVDVEVRPDLAGRERALVARHPGGAP